MRRYIIVASLLCVNVLSAVYTLDTLDSIRAYVDAVPEAPQPDDIDWYQPSFRSFLLSQQPNFFERFRQLFGLWDPRWKLGELERAVENIRNQYTDVKLKENPQGESYRMLALPKNSKVVIWGDLHGAIHSFARGLEEQKRNGYIDNDLKILSNDVYFIILGDAISISPHSAETLTVILHLMEQNPYNVIYLRGTHERNGLWKNYTLREELKARGGALTSLDIPLEKELDALFSSLPRVVYVHMQDSPQELIHVSHGGRQLSAEGINKKDAQFIQRVKATIQGEARYSVMKNSQGLELIGFNYGAVEWSLISCPVWIYQKYLNLKHDAFGILQLGSVLDDASLTLYNRSIEQKDPQFAVNSIYGVTSGQKIDKPEQARDAAKMEQQAIGSTIAISRGLGMQGKAAVRGITSAVNTVNRNGGVAGKLITPFMFDDEYFPPQALNNVKTLINDFDINLVLAPTGMPTLEYYNDLIKKHNGAVLFPITGSTALRDKKHEHMVHLRASSGKEAQALTREAVETHDVKSFALFYQNDDFGISMRDAAIESLKNHGAERWVEVPYYRGAIDFASQAETIGQENPHGIMFLSTAGAAKGLVRHLSESFLVNKILLGGSDLSEHSFRAFLENNGLHCYVALPLPNPHDSELQIAQDFRQAMDAVSWPYDFFAFEGFVAAHLFAHALEKIEAPITNDKIIRWFEQLKNYTFKGLQLTFNTEHRDLSQTATVVRF